MVKRPISRMALVALLLFTASCAKAEPQLTPQGVAAYQAKQVVEALDILRDAAVAAEAQDPKLLSTETTRQVVEFHKTAALAAGAYPAGWQQSVAASLARLQASVAPDDYRKIEPYVVLIKALLQNGT
jgi:hypothetical protein